VDDGAVVTEPRSQQDPSVDLVRRARAGEPVAVDELVRWCYPRVRRWALVRTGDADEADDVAQDVLAGLQERVRQFEGRSRFSTWLFRLTANAAGALARRQARRLRLLGRWSAEQGEDEEERRLAALHGETVARLVRTLLRELPERQRLVFDLADLQGFDAGEIAEMLEIDAATVRGHLMRARRVLRRRILEEQPELREGRP
jgi:RNA polymerase sigma-70 factor (ECF subfamily)